MTDARLNYEQGNRMVVAGLALNTLADLLGADGCDYGLSDSQQTGLVYAVQSLAMLVKDSGHDLAERYSEGAQ